MVRVKELKIFKEIITDEDAVVRAENKINIWLDQKALLDTYFIQQDSVVESNGMLYLVVTIWYTVEPTDAEPIGDKGKSV